MGITRVFSAFCRRKSSSLFRKLSSIEVNAGCSLGAPFSTMGRPASSVSIAISAHFCRNRPVPCGEAAFRNRSSSSRKVAADCAAYWADSTSGNTSRYLLASEARRALRNTALRNAESLSKACFSSGLELIRSFKSRGEKTSASSSSSLASSSAWLGDSFCSSWFLLTADC